MKPLAAAVLTLLLSTTGPAWSQDKTSEGPKPSTEYFPLKKGAVWIYRTNNKTVTVRVTGFVKVNDDNCARLEYRTKAGAAGAQAKDEIIATECITVRKDGVYRCRSNGSEVSPPLCFLKLPFRTGQKWKFDSKVAGQEIKGGFVEGEAKDVKVSAGKGKYDTVTVSSTDMQKIDDKAVTVVYYFAAKVGLVKQVVTIGGAPTTLELKKYEEPKK